MPRVYKSPCYCINTRRSANALKEYYDNAFKNVGLTGAQYYLLTGLTELKKANITQWAEYVGLERSTMVRNVSTLEKHGLIHVIKGKGKVFELTEFGRDTIEKAIPIWEKAQNEIKKYIGEEDAEAIRRIGEKLQNLPIIKE